MIITAPEPATEIEETHCATARTLFGLRPFTEEELAAELEFLISQQIADNNQL